MLQAARFKILQVSTLLFLVIPPPSAPLPPGRSCEIILSNQQVTLLGDAFCGNRLHIRIASFLAESQSPFARIYKTRKRDCCCNKEIALDLYNPSTESALLKDRSGLHFQLSEPSDLRSEA
jgi:hypothetical protein